MNKRIKELAKQAGYTELETNEWPGIYTFNIEKFAELIVQECAKVSYEYLHEIIKEHFGVKE